MKKLRQIVETYDTKSAYDGFHQNDHVIGGHRVMVYIAPKPHLPNHYDVDFTINGRVGRGMVQEPHHQMAILKHVHGVIDKFVEKHKPQAFMMAAHDGDPHSTEKKHQLYHHFAQKIAAKHSGVVHHSQYASVVKFPKNMPAQSTGMPPKRLREEFNREEEGLGYHTYHHETKIGDNHVHVHFGGHKSSGDYNVAFAVNHYTSRDKANSVAPIHPEHQMKILKHIHNTISDFVEKHKPTAISMMPSDLDVHAEKTKSKLYGALAHKIAQKHNGRAAVDDIDSTVFFDHHKKEE